MTESTSKVIKLAKYFNNFFYKLSSFPSSAAASSHLVTPFVIEGQVIGLVKPEVSTVLRQYPEIFCFNGDKIQFSQEINDYEKRSRVVDKLLNTFKQNDLFVTLRGWRNECFEIKPGGGFSDGVTKSSFFEMERSATCLFGIRQFGVDINGYVNHPQKGLCLWLQKRADNKQTWPGKMDNMVGGGLSVGYTVMETALKEACEEAGLSSELLLNLKPTGAVSFYFESERGLFPNTEFVFDLELPIDFIPKNQDGEVQSFLLLSAKEALECCLSEEFKTTSCPVTLDFLLRHGIINTLNEPNLPLLLELLHCPLNSMYTNWLR